MNWINFLRRRNTRYYNYACFMYGCETWSVKLSEEYRLKTVERIWHWGGLKLRGMRQRMIGEDYITSTFKICTVILYFSVIGTRRMRLVNNVARMVGRRGAYRLLVRKLEGNRPLGRPRRRWEDNTTTYLLELRLVHGQDRSGSGGGLLWTRLWTSVCIKCGNFLHIFGIISFSGRTVLHWVS